MDTKVLVEIECPYCEASITIKKERRLKNKTLHCPNEDCGREFNVRFNVNSNPQSYAIDDNYCIEDEQPHAPQKEKTKYKPKTIPSYQTGPVEIEYDDPVVDIPQSPRRPHERPHLYRDFYLTRLNMLGIQKERYRLDVGSNIVGRWDEESQSDIAIKGDSTMSRRSIDIRVQAVMGGCECRMKVMNASNKVTINGNQLKVGDVVGLETGDVIKLGTTRLKFE